MNEAEATAGHRKVVVDPNPLSDIVRRAEKLRSEAADAGGVLYPCGLCHKVFKFKYEYERHAKVHSGDRPWQCGQCFKSFSRKDNMRAHMKIHTGELVRHQCDRCGKTYGRKYDLQVHERVHSGERPFQCGSCGKSFISTSRLRAHQLIHCKNIYLPRHVRNKALSHLRMLNSSSEPMSPVSVSPMPHSTAGEIEIDLDDVEVDDDDAELRLDEAETASSASSAALAAAARPSPDRDSAVGSPADCSGRSEEQLPAVCRIDVAAKMRQLEAALMQRKAELAQRGIKVEVDAMLDLDSRLLEDEAQFDIVLPEPCKAESSDGCFAAYAT